MRGGLIRFLPVMLVAWLVAGLAYAGAARACSGEIPTFDFVLEHASAIARVTVLDGRDDDPSETFHVDRVLKGDLPARVVLEPARSHICGDAVSFFVGAEGGRIGQSAILALDVEFYGQVIHPAWGVLENGLYGSASLPEGVTTLAELEMAIGTALARLPETEGGPISETTEGASPWPILLAVFLGLALLGRLVWSRRVGTDGD